MSAARYEHKYLLEYSKYAIIKGIISPIFNGSNNKFTKYNVNSLYYDTPNLDYFYQKINGEHRHVKVRLRTYNNNFFDQDKYWLETKTKVKERIVKVRSELNEIPNLENWLDLDRMDLLVERAKYKLKPSCFINYEREAFETIHQSEKLRITFDHNMTTSPATDAKLKKYILKYKNKNQVLMEIKYYDNDYPQFLKNLLSNISLKRVYFSKYAEGLNRIRQIL